MTSNIYYISLYESNKNIRANEYLRFFQRPVHQGTKSHFSMFFLPQNVILLNTN